MLGLKAPPRSTCAPAALAIFAVSNSISGDSTVQGPAITHSVPAADLNAAHVDNGPLGFERLADKFVGFEDRHDALDERQRLELLDQIFLIALRRPDHPDDGAFHPFGKMNSVAARVEVGHQFFALCRGRTRLQNDNHGEISFD